MDLMNEELKMFLLFILLGFGNFNSLGNFLKIIVMVKKKFFILGICLGL